MRLLAVALVGCATTSPPPAPIAHHTPQPGPTPAPAPHPSCAGDLAFHRETLVRGRETVIARTGERAMFRGEQFDHFDGGASEVMLQLELFGEPWLPDARDRGIHAFGDHCVRIVEANASQLVLDVALQPAHAYDPHRCQMSCCVTPAQQQPAPDGTTECCFCDDDPTP